MDGIRSFFSRWFDYSTPSELESNPTEQVSASSPGLSDGLAPPQQPLSSTLPPSSPSISRKSHDIIRIALLLREKLPADIIPLVLDHAQLWDLVALASTSREDRVDELRAGKLQTALLIPQYLPQGAVRRVRFIIISKDQGWSSYPADQGTYQGSYTWFEAGVRGLNIDGVVPEDQAALSRPINCGHLRNQLTEREHTQYCIAHPSLYKHGSKRIVTNIHAGKDQKMHVVNWDQEHEDVHIRKMLNELRGGNRIEVSAHALYPAWVNEVKLVIIEIDCAVVRKM